MNYDLLPEDSFQVIGSPHLPFSWVRGMRLYGGGKGNSQPTPTAPDYAGAAQMTGAENKALATQQTWANRPAINTPWGQQTWTAGSGTDPSTGQAVTNWSQNITLSPEQQAANDAQQRITAGRSSTAEGLLGQVASATSQPFDWSGMPGVPGSVKSAQDDEFQRQSALLQPGRTQQINDAETRLANMGLPINSEAYNRAKMQLQSQFTQEDKSLMASSSAQGISNLHAQQGLRSQGIAEEAQRRGMSLNELNALLTGQQVTMPQGMSAPPNTTANQAGGSGFNAAADAQGRYGVGVMNANNQAPQDDWGSALGGIASIAGTGAKMYMSDIRLKKDIVHLVDGWYEYEYVWGGGRRVGMMAQELQKTRPELVITMPNGYLAINYGGL